MVKIPKIIGGEFDIGLKDVGRAYFSKDKLVEIILSCIVDEKRYLLINDKLKRILFNILKAELENESLSLTPTLIYYLALKLVDTKFSIIVQIKNVILGSESWSRLLMRTVGAGFFVAVTLLYTLLTIEYFLLTKNCGHPCSNYFKELPVQNEVINTLV